MGWNIKRSGIPRAAIVTAFLVSLGAAVAQPSQTAKDFEVNWNVRQATDSRLTMLDNSLMGDSIDPDTGGLNFSHTDVSIPGNFGLEVAVRRNLSQGWKYHNSVSTEFGDWWLEVPKVTQLVPEEGGLAFSCSSPQAPEAVTVTINGSSGGEPQEINVPYKDYSDGLHLHVPGQGSKTILRELTGSHWAAGTAMATTDNWIFKCRTPSANTLGYEGLTAYSPAGDEYIFDRVQFVKATDGIVRDQGAFGRTYFTLLATRATDVNGNTVDYTYDSVNRLTSITASDGRLITLSYSGSSKLIASVTANGRTWTYTYGTVPFPRLNQVTLPDSKTWTFDLWAMRSTVEPGTCTAANQTLTVTHPYGMTGTFTLAETKHWRKVTKTPPGPINLAGTCYLDSPGITFNWPYFETMSVTQKTLSGTGYPSSTWTWAYEGWSGQGYATTGGEQKWTEMTDPLSRKTRWFHNRVQGPNENRLEKIEARSGTTVLSTTTNSFVNEAQIGNSYMFGPTSNLTLVFPRRTTGSVSTQDGDTYTTTYAYDTNQAGANYSFGYPTSVSVSTSASTAPRTTVTTYQHNKTKWVLGLPLTTTVNGRATDAFGYDTLGRRIWANQYGTRIADYEYHTDPLFKGALKSVTDALGRKVEALNWKRGTPQQVKRADLTSVYQTVDNNGWIQSITGGRGFITTYTQDNMGRLTSITPSRTQQNWNAATIAYNWGANPVQTITSGNAETRVTYDAMLRPIEVRTRDTGTGWLSHTKTTFNALNEVTFRSFPSATANPTTGVNIAYDMLGRVISETENVAPNAATSYAWLNQHRKTVTDPTGAVTTLHFTGYGGPGSEEIKKIVQPQGITTEMTLNIWGEVERARQIGTGTWAVDQSHYYYYDTRRRLCRSRTPEGGDTLYGYDAASQLTTQQKGAGSGTDCPAPSGTALVTNTYDLRGRMTLRNFADAGTPDIAYTYDNDDNPLTVNRSGVNWTYAYNELSLPTAATLVLDSRTYAQGYTYSNAAALTNYTLPSGKAVTQGVDGLGRVTSVSVDGTGIASGLTYHPNGAVAGATYGNGQVFSQTLTARQQTDRLRSVKGAELPVDLTYAYTARSQIASINDQTVANIDQTFTYDGIGRLTASTGPWGNGTFQYDGLGNLRQRQVGPRTIALSYDANNRLSSHTDTAGSPRSLSYDARGNVTALGALGFTYDFSDQPRTVLGPATGSYTYDGHLRRVKQVVGGVTRYSVYDASGSLIEIDEVSGPKTDYIRASGMTLARIAGSTVTWLHHDHLGSAVAGTNSAGAVVWRESEQPFGEDWVSAAANDNQAGYTGHVEDAATGLTYMQARYYDPIIGRFLSIDPVGFSPARPDMFNRYAYAANDPVNMFDPDGRVCKNRDDGNTDCITDDYFVTFPTPVGFEDTDPDADDFHDYEVRSNSPRGEDETRQWVENNPVPSGGNAATEDGAPNDAMPGAPVVSYLTVNKVTGREVVVNVTLPGHPLGNGVVIREVVPTSQETSAIRNMGEGNGALQAESNIFGRVAGFIINNGAWRLHSPPESSQRRFERHFEFCTRHPGAC
ncbi:MAG: RHS repeat domain-containing protein [Pseudomonadales bacterium]